MIAMALIFATGLLPIKEAGKLKVIIAAKETPLQISKRVSFARYPCEFSVSLTAPDRGR